MSFRAAVVSMPLESIRMPSLALGLLQAMGDARGIPTDSFHLGLDLAQRLGYSLYDQLAQVRHPRLAEWLFTDGDSTLDGAAASSDLVASLASEPAQASSQMAITRNRLALQQLRHELIPGYLDAMLTEIDWGRYGVVLFAAGACRTAASLALAARLKARHPGLRLLISDPSLPADAAASLLATAPAIDCAIVGECEAVFPELVAALADGREPGGRPGVVTRSQGGLSYAGDGPPIDELDALPIPCYDEYFTRAEATGLLGDSAARATPIPFESARGDRRKSPARVAQELSQLARAARSFTFRVAEPIVAGPQGCDPPLPELLPKGNDYQVHCELGSSLTRAQVNELRSLGVVALHLALDSLSPRAARAARTKDTIAQRVNTLRWAQYYSLHVAWQLLDGCPGETAEDRVEQARLAQRLTHLPPPQRVAVWRDGVASNDPTAAAFAAALQVWIDAWKAAGVTLAPSAAGDEDPPASRRPGVRARPSLTYSYSDDFLQIIDARKLEQAAHTFEGPLARLYKAVSDRPIDAASATDVARANVSVSSVERALNEFCERGLMMRDGDQFLSLALPATPGR